SFTPHLPSSTTIYTLSLHDALPISSDLSSMLSYCVIQEFTANCRKISQNCYSTALFTINFATSPIHAENILITLHYKKDFISLLDRKSTRLNSSHVSISYAVFCLKK